MSKLSVAQAAIKFQVSKEAIHNRIRRGSLDCVIEHGMKYVLIDEPSTKEVVSEPMHDKYYNYIEEENSALKDRITSLESQNYKLRDQKEAMLIAQKNDIEQVYKDRDEQLKQILHTISTKFLPRQEELIIEEEIKEDFVDVQALNSEPIRLKKFLNLKDYKPAKRERIKNRFKRLLGQEERVFKHKGKIYIDPSKYSYKDLIND